MEICEKGKLHVETDNNVVFGYTESTLRGVDSEYFYAKLKISTITSTVMLSSIAILEARPLGIRSDPEHRAYVRASTFPL